MNKSPFIYIYDDTLVGLLNLIKKLLKKRIIPTNIKPYNYQFNIFEKSFYLEVEEDTNIIKDIIKYLGQDIFNTIFYLYISNDNNKELLIYTFFTHSLKYKNKVYNLRNLVGMNKILKITQYVRRENHKMKGFVRFKELSNKVLYAEICPENNILFILSKHFKKRLKKEFWMIKDVKRNIISIYDKKDFIILSTDEIKLLNISSSLEEENIESLWKTFYNSISIKERYNNRCRMNFMPKKYWKYITEVRDEI